MANYKQWNRMIADYFIGGLTLGSVVYLSIDENTIINIGSQSGSSIANDEDFLDNFLSAVRTHCVKEQEITLDGIRGQEEDGLPLCVALLGAFILAAYWMAKDENIAVNNYFMRVRQVFGLTTEETGRPNGLRPTGIEEEFWEEWNWWLVQNGYLPSAEPGENMFKYVNYPVSQTILREADKDRLERIFKEEANLYHLTKSLDRELFFSWVQMNNHRFTAKHIRDLLENQNPNRKEALYEALFEVYSSIDWTVGIDTFNTVTRKKYQQRRITTGIYRDRDLILGTVDYLLYPRMPRHFQGNKLEVMKEGRTYLLQKDRPGWFIPLWSEKLAGGMVYQIEGDNQIKELTVPDRGFWFLVSDPEDTSSGIMATWGHPLPFEPFILLCHQQYLEQLNYLQTLGLISWEKHLKLPEPNCDWVELQEFIIKSFDWSTLPMGTNEIFESLRPNIVATISLRGGLRFPHESGWLEDYPPEISIHSSEPVLWISITDVSKNNEPVFEKKIDTNNYFTFPQTLKGEYLVRISKDQMLNITQKLIKILPWTDLTCQTQTNCYETRFGELILQGILVKTDYSGEEN